MVLFINPKMWSLHVGIYDILGHMCYKYVHFSSVLTIHDMWNAAIGGRHIPGL